MYPKIQLVTLICLFSFFNNNATAQGGMWPVYMLDEIKTEMRDAGITIAPEALYNEQKPALNQAVVLFGGGCTGEIVSPKGLFFTNHHCGYSYAQSLSSEKNNYLADGFWAMNNQEEIPCPGLKVSVLQKVENITDFVLKGVNDKMTEAERQKVIDNNIADYEKAFSKLSKLKLVIKPYFDGNEYRANFYEEFNDIRLVGFPPNGIGKFGGDTDNWMWPRHTGDVSIFRIYADKNNQPAEYSKDNQPYKAKQYFNIQTKGYKEGDVSIVYGFPYRTQQYISSYQVDQVQHIIDPIRIMTRGARLAAWDKTMRQDPNIFLKYAAKQSSVSNGWKKWQGEVMGLEKNNVIGKKEKMEDKFQQLSINDKNNKEILTQLQALITANNKVIAANEFIREAGLAPEVISQNRLLDKMMDLYRNDTISNELLKTELGKLQKSADGFFKNYDLQTDMNAFDTLMPIYLGAKDLDAVPAEMNQFLNNSGGNIQGLATNLFINSIVINKDKLSSLLNNANRSDSNLILQDPSYQLYQSIMNHRAKNILPKLEQYTVRVDSLNRKFTQAQRDYNVSGKKLYPDANQTLRVTFGPVKSIVYNDEGDASYVTTLDEVVAKTNPSVEEFNTPQKLLQLQQSKDYGRWASNGTVPIAFIAQNHTSGGNSGSPVLNAKGELIGINFDRVWSGTMSDINYDPELCRNISVDIRYVLFLIEKFGGAGWLLKEMTLK